MKRFYFKELFYGDTKRFYFKELFYGDTFYHPRDKNKLYIKILDVVTEKSDMVNAVQFWPLEFRGHLDYFERDEVVYEQG